MSSKSLAASIAALAFIAIQSPAPANAQAWIGQMVGNMQAQQAAAEREAECRAGKPADESDVKKATEKADLLMAAYFNLSSSSKPRDFRRVFSMKDKDLRWKDAGGVVPVAELGARLDEPTPTLVAVAFIVAGDAKSSRGIWRASKGDDDPAPVIYAVDFQNVEGSFIGFTWLIQHMSVLPGDQEPATPEAYCHFDPDQAF